MGRVVRFEGKPIWKYLYCQGSDLDKVRFEVGVGKFSNSNRTVQLIDSKTGEVTPAPNGAKVTLQELTLHIDDVAKMEDYLKEHKFAEVCKRNNEMVKTVPSSDMDTWEGFYVESDFLFLCLVKKLSNILQYEQKENGKETLTFLGDL